tara:strand:- start:4046 stop:4651 length:606 start_codon:yes stop_codon:yes gene_type:complete
MKKLILAFSILTLIFSISSCKKKESKKVPAEKTFTIDSNKTDINWTAFKTTSKVPVKGKFTKLNITKNNGATSFSEALNGAEFSIPVSSIFSNNTDRDYKLKKLFFGVMKNTELLSGTIHIIDGISGYVDFSMNGVIEKLDFSYTTSAYSIKIKTIMNTDSWQAQSAIASINNACLELHKGADGVSKTWSDVAIDISVFFK